MHGQHLLGADDLDRNAKCALDAFPGRVSVLRVLIQKVLLRRELNLDGLLLVALDVRQGRINLELSLDLLRLIHLDLHWHRAAIVHDDALPENVPEDDRLHVVRLLLDINRHIDARATNQNPFFFLKLRVAGRTVRDGDLEGRGKCAHCRRLEGECDVSHAMGFELGLRRIPRYHLHEAAPRLLGLELELRCQGPGVLHLQHADARLAREDLPEIDERVLICILGSDCQDGLLGRTPQREVDLAGLGQDREGRHDVLRQLRSEPQGDEAGHPGRHAARGLELYLEEFLVLVVKRQELELVEGQRHICDFNDLPVALPHLEVVEGNDAGLRQEGIAGELPAPTSLHARHVLLLALLGSGQVLLLELRQLRHPELALRQRLPRRVSEHGLPALIAVGSGRPAHLVAFQ
mmetsp:Transcript_23511/g.79714  ORF Transcript_23511/g.79714 Transcript_23511/m.79714 type:complete len:406 (+) Transcript_23511:2277-3494(+)